MANPVNWFEIPTKDLQRAKRFYEAVFEMQLTVREMGPLKMAWFPMESGAENATGTLIEAESYVPSHHGSMVYFSVPDITQVLKRVTQHGGRTLNEKTSIGEFGYVAHFEDSEGNRVALHSVS